MSHALVACESVECTGTMRRTMVAPGGNAFTIPPHSHAKIIHTCAWPICDLLPGCTDFKLNIFPLVHSARYKDGPRFFGSRHQVMNELLAFFFEDAEPRPTRVSTQFSRDLRPKDTKRPSLKIRTIEASETSAVQRISDVIAEEKVHARRNSNWSIVIEVSCTRLKDSIILLAQWSWQG